MVGDLDRNGFLDVISVRGIWRNDGQGRFGFAGDLMPKSLRRGAVATGDFDGDGALDFVVANETTDTEGSVDITCFGSATR